MNELNDMKEIRENIIEFKRNNDIKDISNPIKRFNYRGVDCEVMLNDNLNIYCGYLKLKEIDEVIHEVCDKLFHGGITLESKDNKGKYVLGFDCGHVSDITPFKTQDEYNLYYGYDLDIFRMTTFKTDEYVKEVLEKTIDYLIDNILIKRVGGLKMKDMNELTELIEKWAEDTGLTSGDFHKQTIKLGEEYGELCQSLLKGKEDKVKDAIGDIFVVITILAMQKGYSVDECIALAYNEIKGRVDGGLMVDGVFIKGEDLNA